MQGLGQAQPGYIEISSNKLLNPETHLLADFLSLDGKKIDTSKLNLEQLPVAIYDEAIGDINRLQELTLNLRDIPGAMGKDGPLQKVLELGFKGSKTGALNTARGAYYELEVAQELRMSGHKICQLGSKERIQPFNTREFDIITDKLMIECKNIDWSTASERAFSIFTEQKLIAEAMGKEFVIYSKQDVPLFWIKKLADRGIKIIVKGE